jgi:hypothetical protein
MNMIDSVSNLPLAPVQQVPQTPKAVNRDGNIDGSAPNAGVAAAQNSPAPNRALDTTV